MRLWTGSELGLWVDRVEIQYLSHKQFAANMEHDAKLPEMLKPLMLGALGVLGVLAVRPSPYVI